MPSLNLLLLAFVILSLALGVSAIIRAKFKCLQDAYIPASLIAGLILLICAEFNLINQEIISIFAKLPGLLIVPIIACVPLGIKFGANKIKIPIAIALLLFGVSMLQFAIGLSSQWLFNSEHYASFGFELGIGFVGGHGTAGVLASMLKDAQQSYWQDAQSLAIGTATIGLIGGMILGMCFINYASKKHKLFSQQNDNEIQNPANLKDAFNAPIAKSPNSYESFLALLGLVLGISALAFYLKGVLKNILVLKSISVWGLAMILMLVIWLLLKLAKKEHLINQSYKSKICAFLSDFAIAAAIASMRLDVLALHLNELIYMCVLGFLLTAIYLFISMKLVLKKAAFEHALALWGSSTGVFLTGILLLRIADPKGFSKALENYSLGYTISGLVFYTSLNFLVMLSILNSPFIALLACLVLCVITSLAALFFKSKEA